MVQDHKGFIWLGTYDGLNKYDGIKVTPYKGQPGDTVGFILNSIRALYADKEDNLWCGLAGGGLLRIDLKTGSLKNYLADSSAVNALSNAYVNSITEPVPGKLYIGTNGGLNILDKATGSFTLLSVEGKEPAPFLSDVIKFISPDQNGHLWLGHPTKGVTDYDLKTGTSVFYTNESKERHLCSNNIKAVYADKKGKIWVSCWNFGISVIDVLNNKVYNPTDTTHPINKLNKISLVSQFCEDKEGNIWCATAERGLGKFEAGTYELSFFEHNKDDPETINDNTVFSVLQDRSGLIWTGTWKGGASIMDPKALKFGHYKYESTKENRLSNNNVFSFGGNSEKEIYIGTSGGVNIFNNSTKSFSLLPTNKKDGASIRDNSICQAVLKDDDQSIWVASNGAGLYHYYPEKNSWENFVPSDGPQSISHHSPSNLIKDLKGRLWVSSLNGIDLYDREKKTFRHFVCDPGDPFTLSSSNLSCFALRKDGKLWVGTNDNGFNLFDTETHEVKRYCYNRARPDSFPDIGVAVISFDAKENLWISSSAGLCYFDAEKEKLSFFNELHPIFGAVAYGIEIDASGKVWFCTSNDLCRFDPVTKQFRIFSTADGVQGRQFSMHGSMAVEDKLLFGGLNGFNIFDPSKIPTDSIAPEVAFTGFTVLNKPYKLDADISYAKEIILSYKNYFFGFEFAALDFSNPKKNTYEYQLEGFNDSWVKIGTENSVTFTNLDPGEYTLMVRASNNNGIWCKNPASVKIIITPPFWRTTWFYMLCLILMTLIIYSYIKWRERTLQQEKTILENKVEARTTELKVEKQKVESAHKDIKDSINYAKKIQEAILPEEEEIGKYIGNYFILYKPKDIVAGDFYWFHSIPDSDRVLVAAADCTGHGVPGAFMSMIGSTFLNEIVRKGIHAPDKILNELNINVRRALKQNTETSQSRDGMDIALCLLDQKNLKLFYSGANRPCLIVREDEISEYKADKFPIGGLYRNEEDKFTPNEISLQAGDMVYLFSDGYADQFGGDKGKKFMHKHLKDLLVEISKLPMNEQKEKLDRTMTQWRGSAEQVDDILVIGVRV
jgi:ligand-binding sensor domain-containing protein/serine phosphatase RsbU (regulator of sigma subunit)